MTKRFNMRMNDQTMRRMFTLLDAKKKTRNHLTKASSSRSWWIQDKCYSNQRKHQVAKWAGDLQWPKTASGTGGCMSHAMLSYNMFNFTMATKQVISTFKLLMVVLQA